MQANADVIKCYTNAAKSEAKGIATINKGVAQACKTQGSAEQVTAKLAKTAAKTNAKLVKIAEKNNALDTKLEGLCDTEVTNTFITGADPYGVDQSPVPAAATFEAIFAGVQGDCNPPAP
jgi:hypothetical protein